MSKKLVYLSGDDTVRVLDEERAEQWQDEMFNSALDYTRAEGNVANDEDSEDYDSDIALKAGQEADGECKIFDLGDILDVIKSKADDEYNDFIDELREAGEDPMEIVEYEKVSEILNNEMCESSKIY